MNHDQTPALTTSAMSQDTGICRRALGRLWQASNFLPGVGGCTDGRIPRENAATDRCYCKHMRCFEQKKSVKRILVFVQDLCNKLLGQVVSKRHIGTCKKHMQKAFSCIKSTLVCVKSICKKHSGVCSSPMYKAFGSSAC